MVDLIAFTAPPSLYLFWQTPCQNKRGAPSLKLVSFPTFGRRALFNSRSFLSGGAVSEHWHWSFPTSLLLTLMRRALSLSLSLEPSELFLLLLVFRLLRWRRGDCDHDLMMSLEDGGDHILCFCSECFGHR